MTNLSHKPRLSKFTLNRSIGLLVAITFVLTGGYLLAAQAHPERGESGHKKWEHRKEEKMEKVKLKVEELVERKIKGIIARLNLSDEEAEGMAPKVKAVVQHRIEQRKTLGQMVKTLKKTMVAGEDAEVRSALEELKAKQSALETELEALETALLEGLTPRQEALLTLAGVVNKGGGYQLFKDWRGHAKKKFKDGDHRRGGRHSGHGHDKSKYDHEKSGRDR